MRRPTSWPPGPSRSRACRSRRTRASTFPCPLEAWVYDASRWDFDVVFAQTTSLLLEFGVWLRKMRGIPLLCVNTTHLAGRL